MEPGVLEKPLRAYCFEEGSFRGDRWVYRGGASSYSAIHNKYGRNWRVYVGELIPYDPDVAGQDMFGQTLIRDFLYMLGEWTLTWVGPGNWYDNFNNGFGSQNADTSPQPSGPFEPDPQEICYLPDTVNLSIVGAS